MICRYNHSNFPSTFGSHIDIRCQSIMFSSEINRNSALKDDKWRSIINGTEQNWYLEHRTDYGSIKWIKWRMIIYAFTAVLAFGFQKNLDYFQFNWWNSVTLNTAYWISYIWRFGYAQVVPFCIFLYIFRYLSILDDAIGLRKEVKNIAVLFTIINILMFIIPMSSLIISTFFLDIWDTYYELISLITLINTFVVRILYFIINYKGTRWVVSKFGYMHRDRSGTGFKDSSTISLSLTRMRNITFDDNTVTLLNGRNNSMSLNLEELERFIEMKQILSSNIEFDRFMRHLVKVQFRVKVFNFIHMINDSCMSFCDHRNTMLRRCSVLLK